MKYLAILILIISMAGCAELTIDIKSQTVTSKRFLWSTQIGRVEFSYNPETKEIHGTLDNLTTEERMSENLRVALELLSATQVK